MRPNSGGCTLPGWRLRRPSLLVGSREEGCPEFVIFAAFSWSAFWVGKAAIVARGEYLRPGCNAGRSINHCKHGAVRDISIWWLAWRERTLGRCELVVTCAEGQFQPSQTYQVKTSINGTLVCQKRSTLFSPIPAGQFWSFMGYDGQSRSMLETDQKLGGLDSTRKDIQKNADGSLPCGSVLRLRQGTKRIGCRRWNTLLRLYAHLDPWFDKPELDQHVGAVRICRPRRKENLEAGAEKAGAPAVFVGGAGRRS